MHCKADKTQTRVIERERGSDPSSILLLSTRKVVIVKMIVNMIV